MHPAIILIKNEKGETLKQVDTQLAFTPELSTTIYHNGVKALVTFVCVDITPQLPAIIIHAKIK